MSVSFGERLKELRKGINLTQASLAETLGVHLQTVSKWERGISEPDLSVLGELAAALGITLEKLLAQEEDETAYTGSFDAVRLGKTLAAARRAKGEGQETIAAVAAASADIVSKWERGVVCPDMRQLCTLADYFSVPVSKLYFGITEEVRTETPVQARRRRRFSFVWAGACVLLCVCVAVLLMQLYGGEKFIVTVSGQTYEVESDEWFTPPAPSREGYDFAGFADAAGEFVTFPRKITENEEYTAVFTPHEYNIDYWLNGGAFLSGAEYTFTVESGAFELAVPQKAGAVFEGWFLAPDYAGEPVESIECAGADVKLYAKWSDEVYTIRYELGGGSLTAENPAQVTSEKEITLAEPVRRGYNFLGWYDAPAGGTRYLTVGGANAKNVALYALWQETGAQYTVLYDTCGGNTLGENPVSVGAGEVHVLYGAQKTGYDFLGWNTAADGSGSWCEVLSGIRGDLYLYAVYSPKTYTVVYELDGGTYYKGINPNKIAYGESVSLFPVAKAGHTFSGWFDAPSGGERVTKIDAGNILRLTTLYARFEAKEYTVALNGAGGTFTAEGESRERYTYNLRYGQTLELPVCTLAGYDFLGWFDGQGNLVAEIDSVNIGNLSLTARYRKAGLTYKITYEAQGGELPLQNPAEVAYGQVLPLHAPEHDGYLFLGWNDRPDGSGDYYTATPAGREEDLTLYAVWQELTVSGKADDFKYEMGQETVTITAYTGTFGANIDLVIPSYIEDKPVVAVEGAVRYSDSHPEPYYLHSLVIPDTVERLGADAFCNLYVAEPVVIPASVKEMGEGCFRYSTFSLYFAENSALRTLSDYALAGTHINNVVALPHGLETLGSYAFTGAWIGGGGIVLPETLEYIGTGAFSCCAGSSNAVPLRIYLPASVRYIEAWAFDGGATDKYIYTPLTEEQAAAFSPNWCRSQNSTAPQVQYALPAVSGITLECGDETVFLEGRAFALPSPEKQGCTFLGWRDTQGDFVNPFYIPMRGGVVLQAVFEEKSNSDGRTESSPVLLGAEQEYELLVLPQGDLFFLPDVASGRIRIELSCTAVGWTGGRSCGVGIERASYTDPNDQFVPTDVSFAYEEGTVLKLVRGSDIPCHFRVKIRVSIVGKAA